MDLSEIANEDEDSPFVPYSREDDTKEQEEKFSKYDYKGLISEICEGEEYEDEEGEEGEEDSLESEESEDEPKLRSTPAIFDWIYCYLKIMKDEYDLLQDEKVQILQEEMLELLLKSHMRYLKSIQYSERVIKLFNYSVMLPLFKKAT